MYFGFDLVDGKCFLIDTQEGSLRNSMSGLVIHGSVRCNPSVTVLHLYLEPVEDGEIMWIIDTSERYSR